MGLAELIHAHDKLCVEYDVGREEQTAQQRVNLPPRTYQQVTTLLAFKRHSASRKDHAIKCYLHDVVYVLIILPLPTPGNPLSSGG